MRALRQDGAAALPLRHLPECAWLLFARDAPATASASQPDGLPEVNPTPTLTLTLTLTLTPNPNPNPNPSPNPNQEHMSHV